MSSRRFVKFIAAGQIRNEFIIDKDGRAHNNILGGSLAYAGTALQRWGGATGLLGVVSQNFPHERIEQLAKHGLDIRGIKTIPETWNPNDFFAYSNYNSASAKNPVAMYAAQQLPLPRELLDHSVGVEYVSITNPESRIFPEDIPSDYLNASAAHICPLEIASQLQLTTLLQRGSIRTTSIQTHPSCMVPEKLDEIALLARDTTAIITSEAELRALFNGISGDIWEIMERIGQFGCQNIVVRNASNGFSMYQSEYGKRFQIPQYPVNRIDPTGEMDVFSGALLAGLHESYDPLYTLILAAVAASIKVEGSGPFFIQDSLPGLDQARVEALRSQITFY